LEGEFISTVQKRGAAIIKARGLSSAASAANAVVDTVVSLTNETPAGDWHSVAVCSPGAYGIEKGLMASMPIRTNADGSWSVVEGVPVDEFSQGKIDATINELLEEKAAVQDLIPA
jgi:malate dehydrogenase